MDHHERLTQRIDAANAWRGVAHYLAGFAAGSQEAAVYRAATGRCLRDDIDMASQAASHRAAA